jgi:putative heme-binding domain-containing protein
LLFLSFILICPSTRAGQRPAAAPAGNKDRLFARDNLIAWCIVPFDGKKRGPEERAAMLERLGFRHFAYDWRPEHIPSFDAEVDALKRHGVSLDAFWVAPGVLNRESRIILDVLKRHGVKAQLWVLLDLGGDRATGAEQERRVEAAAAQLRPLAEEAAKIGCSLALYNHGGWFGEPENQLAIVDRLRKQGIANIGIVYNLHHGHDHLGRFAEILAKLKPHLVAINLNGMDPDGDRVGRKILPLGQGSRDLELLRIIRDSGYRGPIGILGHTDDDAEERLRDNLDGLDWLLPQLDGKSGGPRPRPRTTVPAPPAAATKTGSATPAESAQVSALIADAREHGDRGRGAAVFAAPQFACLSCHRVGGQGGSVGPDLSTAGACIKPEELVESLLWPGRRVKEGYEAVTVATAGGRVLQGFKHAATPDELTLRDPATGDEVRIKRSDIEAVREGGTLMPEGLATAMTSQERTDLVRFLLDLGRPGQGQAATAELLAHAHAPASFPYDRAPLHPEDWPSWRHPVNRDRVYDFYAKEAQYFSKQPTVPMLLPPYPGLDGGTLGHWGNQSDATWVDGRWNQTDLGTLLCGIFRGAGVTVPKAVCVRLGDRGELATCFNPETLCYEAVWSGGFLRFDPKRHGLLDGLILDGTPLPRPQGKKPDRPFVYHGFYRNGNRVVFSYRIGDVDLLDSPWVEEGRFIRLVAPAAEHPLLRLRQGGGMARWPQVLNTRGHLGRSGPYTIDTIEPPFDNPWKALLFFGDHDFLPDGTAMICTMVGDVWSVKGLDATLQNVRWRRYASGLHQALGLIVVEGKVNVLGRDQITRLHDVDGDGEADYYECVSNTFETSPAGHDFVSGLQRDASGRFYTASSKQGLLRITANGRAPEILATGFRNPDGLGLAPDGTITVPCSEGEWTPASMVCEIKLGGHYGYLGPRAGQPPDLPLVYLPRGLDNSSSAQVTVPDDRFGPLKGQMLHFSFGTGTYFLLLRERVDGQPQGAVVPMPGEFLSGAHRGRFNPRDGQLYVSGMTGWGTYTSADGCFQRVRYTGEPAQLPLEFHAHENGVLVRFSRPLDAGLAGRAGSHFAQAWNYRYSSGYGSPELSPRHPGLPGHDALAIRSAHVLADGLTLFLEIPDLQPVNQLHLHLLPHGQRPLDLFATVHRLSSPFTGFPGYRPVRKTIAAHPILADMAAMAHKPVPNRWRFRIPKARSVTVEAGKNLSYTVRSFMARPGEPIHLTFMNPDVVPHNWALIKPGTLSRVGDLVNKIVAEPDAASRHYIPRSDDVLVYTDIVGPQDQFSVFFRAPTTPGRYPYLCTFPGHWMVMNGEMIVK